jgi:hypothetical protein
MWGYNCSRGDNPVCGGKHFSRGITLYVEDKGVITLYLDIYMCRKRNTI